MIRAVYYFTAFLVVVAVAIPVLSQAATYTVTKTADTADGTCDADCSLREAIIAANANGGDDVITLPAGTYTLSIAGTGEDSSATGDLDITGSDKVTINGAHRSTTTVDANDIDRVFDVTSTGTFELNDVTVTGGNFSGSGGGVDVGNQNATVTLNDCVLTSNTSGDYGGGANLAGDSTVTNCIISNNTALTGGGLSLDATSAVTGSTITGNTAEDAGGGIESFDATTITNTSISNNSTTGAGLGGGGVYHTGSGSVSTEVLTVSNSLVSGNTSSGNAGAMYFGCTNATHKITNTTIINNSADGASGEGGGIFNNCANHGSPTQSNTVNISHSTITGNTTGVSGSGGGIRVGQGGDEISTVNVRNTIISDNDDSSPDGNCSVEGTGTLSSSDYNIENANTCGFAETNDQPSTDPKLTTSGLDDYGGPTNSVILQASSPAVDNGICTDIGAATVTTDQRGFARPESSLCDIGAVERDQTNPNVTLQGGSPYNHECSQSYSDPGSTMTDNFESGLPVTVDTSSLDVDTLGRYTVPYSSSDHDGNSYVRNRTVDVVDTAAPAISLNGSSNVTVYQYDTYSDAGATAADDCEGNATVATSNPVDANTIGAYTVTYTSTDGQGNKRTKTRTVNVVDRGEVTNLVPLTNNQVRVEYANAGDQIFTIFNKGSKKPLVKLTQDGDRIVASNKVGTKVALLDANSGEIYVRKDLRSKSQDVVKIRSWDFYTKQSDPKEEFVIATLRNGTIRTTIFTVTTANGLKNKDTERYDDFQKNDFKLKRSSASKSFKRVLLKKKNGDSLVKYRVTEPKRQLTLVE